jgi:hypothetical protein
MSFVSSACPNRGPHCRRQRALIYGPACPLPACAKQTEAGLTLGFEDATPRPTAYKDAARLSALMRINERARPWLSAAAREGWRSCRR